ncbi:MAG TPA: acid phosphatase [Ruminococcaceae bacterium]|nr:acid phosphatase [Oscillospiraceae bacterium]
MQSGSLQTTCLWKAAERGPETVLSGLIMRGTIMNWVILSAILAWGTAQLIKVINCRIHGGKVTLRVAIGTGGMPSSHSAFVCATAFASGMVCGFSSVEFALGVALAAVVIYDALGIRWEAGLHAKAINQLEVKVEPKTKHTPLETSLGHQPSEVICGGLLGIGMAIFIEGVFALHSL